MTFAPGPHEQELIRLRDTPYWDAATTRPVQEAFQYALTDLHAATALLTTETQGATILAAIESATSTIKDAVTVVAPIPTVDVGVQKANDALDAARRATLPQGSLSEGDATALSIADVGAKVVVPGYGLVTLITGFNPVAKVNAALAEAREEEAARQVEILKGELDAARRAITKPEPLPDPAFAPDPLDPADFGLGPQPGPAPTPGPAPGAPHTLSGGTWGTGGTGGTGTGLTGSTGGAGVGAVPYGTPPAGTSGTSGVGGTSGTSGTSGVGGTSGGHIGTSGIGGSIGGSGGFSTDRTAVDSLMGGSRHAGLGILGAGTAGLGLGVAGKIGGSMMGAGSAGAMGGSAGGFGALSAGGMNGAGGMGSASSPITSHPVRLTITNPNGASGASSGFAPGRGLLSGTGTGTGTGTGVSGSGTTSSSTGTSSGARNTMMGSGGAAGTGKKDKPEPRTGLGLIAPKLEETPITLRPRSMMAGSRKPTTPAS